MKLPLPPRESKKNKKRILGEKDEIKKINLVGPQRI